MWFRAPRVVAGSAAVVASALLLGGCARTSTGAAAQSLPVAVVASTNVWGDVASSIGGVRVKVTSVIDESTADPHSYEASARTELAVSRARVVVENGGGYDDFMHRLLGVAHSRATVVDAVDASGRAAQARAAGTELNEHVWYDVASVAAVTDRLVSALSAADPAGGATYRANGDRLHAGLDALGAREQAARLHTAGVGVAVTEPVPLYMLQALGAVNRTPPAFSRAVENGDDVSPSVLQETTALLSTGAVRALVYNAQTANAQTTAVRSAAAAAHVAVVPVTETLPRGKSYLDWMGGNLDALVRALSS